MSMSDVSLDACLDAVARPERRRMLELLAAGEQSVGDLVHRTRLRQPLVSKHLRVLRQAKLIQVRTAGRRRLYRIHGPAMKQLHEWTGGFAQFWEHQLDAIKARAQAAAVKAAAPDTKKGTAQ